MSNYPNYHGSHRYPNNQNEQNARGNRQSAQSQQQQSSVQPPQGYVEATYPWNSQGTSRPYANSGDAYSRSQDLSSSFSHIPTALGSYSQGTRSHDNTANRSTGLNSLVYASSLQTDYKRNPEPTQSNIDGQGSKNGPDHYPSTIAPYSYMSQHTMPTSLANSQAEGSHGETIQQTSGSISRTSAPSYSYQSATGNSSAEKQSNSQPVYSSHIERAAPAQPPSRSNQRGQRLKTTQASQSPPVTQSSTVTTMNAPSYSQPSHGYISHTTHTSSATNPSGTVGRPQTPSSASQDQAQGTESRTTNQTSPSQIQYINPSDLYTQQYFQAQEAARAAEAEQRAANEARARAAEAQTQAEVAARVAGESAVATAVDAAQGKSIKTKPAKNTSKKRSSAKKKTAETNPTTDEMPDPQGDDDMADELRTMLEKLRGMRSKDPSLFAKLWGDFKKPPPATQSASTQPSATPGYSTSEQPSAIASQPAASQPTPATSTPQKADKDGLLPYLGRFPAQRRRRPKKSDAAEAVATNPTPASPGIGGPVQAPIENTTNAGQQHQKTPVSKANQSTITTKPQSNISQPGSSKPQSKATPAQEATWPAATQQKLAKAASEYLGKDIANKGKECSPESLMLLLKNNPTYPDLCAQLESRGFTLDRQALARFLLAAVPALVSGQEQKRQEAKKDSPLSVPNPSVSSGTARPPRASKPAQPAQPTAQSQSVQPSEPARAAQLPPPAPPIPSLSTVRIFEGDDSTSDFLVVFYSPRHEGSALKMTKSSLVRTQNESPRVRTQIACNRCRSRRSRCVLPEQSSVCVQCAEQNESCVFSQPGQPSGSPLSVSGNINSEERRAWRRPRRPDGAWTSITPVGPKAEQARKRLFSEIVDMSQASSDDEDMASDDEGFQRRSFTAAPPVVPGPSNVLPPDSMDIDIDSPHPAEQSVSDSRFEFDEPDIDFDPDDEYVLDEIKRLPNISKPIKPSAALKRVYYNPKSIARDVMLATGRHPNERPLNAHLMHLAETFVGVTLHSDFETFRWDLVDPGGPPMPIVELEDILVEPPRLTRKKRRHRDASREGADGRGPTSAADTQQGETTQTSQQQQQQLLPSVSTSGKERVPMSGTPTTGQRTGRRGRPPGAKNKNPSKATLRALSKQTAGSSKKTASTTATAPPPAASVPEPSYPVFTCEWGSCPAQLHDVHTLERHVLKNHVSGQTSCQWQGCPNAATEYSGEGLSDHLIKAHIQPLAWKYGGGPSINGTVPDLDRFLTANGLIVTPDAATAGESDTLIFPAESTSIRAFNKLYGDQKPTDRARQVLRAVRQRRKRVGIGLEQEGCEFSTPVRNKFFMKDEEYYEVVEENDDSDVADNWFGHGDS